jgi:hypothetical protein
MPRYIDAEKLIKKIFPVGLVDGGNYTINAKAVKCAIDHVPTADVVEVVRCKDCKHYIAEDLHCRKHFCIFGPDAYCSYGERKVE